MQHSLLVLAILSSLGAGPVAEPIREPYAQRTLLATDFVRREWTDPARQREVPVKIYFPTDAAGPFPVILFSHGLGGTRETYEYLGRQWAANGYVVIHLQHPGSDDSAWRGQDRPMQSMQRAANGRNAIDRARDVTFVIDQLEQLNASDPKMKGKLDIHQIGLAGHSFGAQTTLLSAGQRLGGGRFDPRIGKLSDDRIKAAIPMSAPVPVMKNQLEQVYADIHIPTFHMTGTADNSPIGDTTADERTIPFDHIKAERYLLVFNGGDHMVFSGRIVDRPHDADFQRLIRLSSTAFWDAFLKHDEAAKRWLDDDGFAKELGDLGNYQHKLADSPK